jgi:hypothetical protein
MGYRNLINTQLKLAFNAVKDLATVTTVVNKTNSGFDFNSKGVTVPRTANVSAKVVALDRREQGRAENKVTVRDCLLRQQEVGDVNEGDTISLDDGSYVVGPITNSEGFTISFEAFKEG